MSDEEVVLPKVVTSSEKVELWFYFAYFGICIVGNSIVSLISGSRTFRDPGLMHYVRELVTLCGDIAFFGFLIWLMKRSLSDFGLRKGAIAAWPWVAILVILSQVVTRYVLDYPLSRGLVYNSLMGVPWFGQRGIPWVDTRVGLAIALVTLLVSAFYQEAIYRGVLLTRLIEIFGSTNKAVLVSSVLFALAHAYQGISVLPGHFVFAATLCWFYLRCGSIWPLVIGHFFINAAILIQESFVIERVFNK